MRVEVERARRRPARTAPPRGTTRSRSISERTVSTANSGMPSAARTSASRTPSGRPATSPSRRAAMSASVSALEVQDRGPPVGGQAGSVGEQARVGPAAHEAREVRRRRAGARGTEQPVVGVLGVVDDEHHRVARRRRPRSRNTVHAANRSSRGERRRPRRRRAGQPSRGSQPGPLLRVGDVAGPGRARAASPTVVVGSSARRHSAAAPEPAPDRLGQRAEGDALAVGQAPAAVPPHRASAGRRRTSRTPSRAGSCRPRPRPRRTSSAGRPDSSAPWNSSLTSRSSRSRPTSGASSPSARCAPPTRGHHRAAPPTAAPGRPCPSAGGCPTST